MKKTFRGKNFIKLVLATCVLAIAGNASAKNPKEVELRIENDQMVIITKANSNDCSIFSRRDAGCIRLKKYETSDIYFHLRGDTRCGKESGTNWVLDSVLLGGFDSASKPSDFGFETTSQADYNQVNNDFTNVDKKTGRVKSAVVTDRRIKISDKNHTKYDIWYNIVATCKRDDGGAAHTTSSDPRVKNGGMGNG